VHQAVIEEAGLDLVHVQADEIRVKGRQMIAWMGLAMMVSTRLWLGGVVSLTRDHQLANRLLGGVHRCAKAMRPLLICTDGWAAYPKSIRLAFREKVKCTAGRGRTTLLGWPEVLIGTVIKHTRTHHLISISRQMTQGALSSAEALLAQSHGGSLLNTAFIERLNATFRQRTATLTRRTRHAAHHLSVLTTGMYLIGCVYNFCSVHDELSSSKHLGVPTTPAMAAGLTDHLWSLRELLMYRVAPQPYSERAWAKLERERLIALGQMKRQGRPPKRSSLSQEVP
jgi:IS1 family transposase